MNVNELVGKTVNVNWNMETTAGGNKFSGGNPWNDQLVVKVSSCPSGWFATLQGKPIGRVNVERLSLSNGDPLNLSFPEEKSVESLPIYLQTYLLNLKAQAEGMNPSDKSLYTDYAFRFMKKHYPHLVKFWNVLKPKLETAYKPKEDKKEKGYILSMELQDMFMLMVLNDEVKAKDYFMNYELLKGKITL